MKIAEYKQMMAYLTRPGFGNGGNVLPKKKPKEAYVTSQLKQYKGPVVAVSDYMKIVSDQIAPYVPGAFTSLGTDGFGRSESRESLRTFFEVDAAHVVLTVLTSLVKEGQLDKGILPKAMKSLGIKADKVYPIIEY